MSQSATRYQEAKEVRIQMVMDTLTIDTIGDATFATVPSTSDTSKVYTVDIDESGDIPHATNCDCPGHADYGHTCVHMIGLNAFYQRIHTLLHPVVEEVVSVGEAMTQAVESVKEHIESSAVAGDKSYAEAVGYASDPRTTINPKTGMTDEQWTQHRCIGCQVDRRASHPPGKDKEMNEQLTGIIRIRAQWMLSLDFTWMDSLNLWMSTAWWLSDILRYVERLQERGIVCSYERREWGHKGYWHILINADQQEAVARVVAEDHAAWLAEKAENDARYAASLVGNPEHTRIDWDF